MNSEQRERLAHQVLAYSTAERTEVVVTTENFALTRFTHNAIHQNVAQHDVVVSIRAIIGGKTGVVRTNRLDEASLRQSVRRASEIAALSPDDPDQPKLPSGGTAVTPQGAFVPQTAQASAQMRASMSAEIFAQAQAADLWAAGYVQTGESGVSIVNTSGASASFDGTDTGINVKANGADSSGYAEAYANDIMAVDARAIGLRAASKAVESASPQAGDPGAWTVILEPAAFGELVSYIADHFSAQSFHEGSSFLSDGLGRSYLGENITISDDHANPKSPGMPFDFEGTPTQRLALIEAGVATNIVTDSYWANKLSRANTGHALPAPNAYGPQPTHLVISGGEKSTQQLIAETKRGLLVSRFWYIRTVDQRRAIVTGMTRDGTFLIENGKVGGGVRNMRFNQSILEALRHCELASELTRTGGYSYSMVVPTAKIDGFTFSSGTDF
ncbi:MAG: TldD/PmbA family protein [Candidatus Eremiobacteraeota bacterium]|nr:TldD/PmbA family protein [Candidatus Eremiobacteraeota bacterium]